MQALIGKSISEIQQLLRQKQVSAAEILEAHWQHIHAHEKEIDAFLCLTPELAKKQAAAIDDKIARGDPLPRLAGVPVAIKDALCVAGYATTCGSKILQGFIPSYQSTAATRLFEAGAICIGKTNMDEFGMGSSTENSAFKRTRNPWNVKHVPGGSSGGSAAAVAAGFAGMALGEDTGGSVRQPASFCGIVGMKPTYGLISRFGVIAFASSLDQVGAFARGVEDTASLLTAIAGYDPQDATSIEFIVDPKNQGETKNGTYDFTDGLAASSPQELAGKLKIGIVKELLGEGVDAEVSQAISAAGKIFAGLGATVDEVSIPTAKSALPVYYIIATAEASANLARFDGVKYGYRDMSAKDIFSMYVSSRQEGFGPEVKRRIMLGTYVLTSGYYDAYYKKAQQVRRLLKQDFDKVFAKYDLLLLPTAPTAAFQFDEKTTDPISMYLADIATIPISLAGLPGISVPCGFTSSNLPLGLQIVGNTLADAVVLRAARAFEKVTTFHQTLSPLLSKAV